MAVKEKTNLDIPGLGDLVEVLLVLQGLFLLVVRHAEHAHSGLQAYTELQIPVLRSRRIRNKIASVITSITCITVQITAPDPYYFIKDLKKCYIKNKLWLLKNAEIENSLNLHFFILTARNTRYRYTFCVTVF